MSGLVVTGATGFVGSAVCRVALGQGMRVWGVVRAAVPEHPIEGVSYLPVDWDSPASLESALRESRADRIVHCAGVTPRVASTPRDLYEGNVRLTWQLMSAIGAAAPRARVVLASSAVVYGSAALSPVSEEIQPAPDSHYGWSKRMAEDVARAHVREEGIHVSIARVFNLLGEGEPAGSLVSDVLAQLEAGAPAVLLREDASVRDYLDVSDGAAALLHLSSRGGAGEAYNVCSGKGVSVTELVRSVIEVWGSDARVEVRDSAAVPSVSIGNGTRLAALGWRARSDVRTALERLRATRPG